MKNIPEFKNETEESEFWLKNDSTEYIDWQNAKSVSFTNLKPSAKSISIILPEMLLSRFKQEANKLDRYFRNFHLYSLYKLKTVLDF